MIQEQQKKSNFFSGLLQRGPKDEVAELQRPDISSLFVEPEVKKPKRTAKFMHGAISVLVEEGMTISQVREVYAQELNMATDAKIFINGEELDASKEEETLIVADSQYEGIKERGRKGGKAKRVFL